MSFGILLQNSSGDDLWYGEEKSIVLVGKGHSVFADRNDYKPTGYYGIDPPIVYAHFPGGQAYSSGLTRRTSSGQWEVSIFVDWFLTHNIEAYWYVFAGIPQGLPSGAYGLAVYTTSGKLAYHTNYLPLFPLVGGVLSRSGGGEFQTPNLPPKYAIKIVPPALFSFSGSQSSGGFSASVRLPRDHGNKISLGFKNYAGNFASPGTIYGAIGSWDSTYVDIIDGGFYD